MPRENTKAKGIRRSLLLIESVGHREEERETDEAENNRGDGEATTSLETTRLAHLPQRREAKYEGQDRSYADHEAQKQRRNGATIGALPRLGWCRWEWGLIQGSALLRRASYAACLQITIARDGIGIDDWSGPSA